VTRVVQITVERPTRDPLHQNAPTELSSQAQLERHTISAVEHGWMCPDQHCTARRRTTTSPQGTLQRGCRDEPVGSACQ
jgi:hypothetical protein